MESCDYSLVDNKCIERDTVLVYVDLVSNTKVATLPGHSLNYEASGGGDRGVTNGRQR